MWRLKRRSKKVEKGDENKQEKGDEIDCATRSTKKNRNFAS